MMRSQWRLLACTVFLATFSIGKLASHRAHAAEMVYPLSVVADGSGTIFVADRELPGIWKISEGALSVFSQGEKKIGTPLNAVRCLALDQEGKLLAGDSATRDVYRVDATGKLQPLTKGGIGIPIAIAVAKSGDIFVADLELHFVYKVPSAGGKPAEFAKVNALRGMTIDGDDNLWIVCNLGDLLIKLAPDAKKAVVVKGQPLTSPSFPAGVVVDKDGVAYIADGYNKAVWKVAADGKPVKFASGEPLIHPVGLAWNKDKLLVADPRAKGLIEIVDGKGTKVELK